MFEVSEEEAQDYGQICKKCEEWQFWESYWSDPSAKWGIRGTCKFCRKTMEREYYLANHDARKSYSKEYYHRTDIDVTKINRARRYRLTLKQLTSLYDAQQNRCAWCGDHEDDLKYLCVDHNRSCCPGDRSCGKCVRRLLCEYCNLAEGLLSKKPHLIVKMETIAWMPLDVVQSEWKRFQLKED